VAGEWSCARTASATIERTRVCSNRADISFRSGAQAVEFTNGSEVTFKDASASFDEDIQKAQIVETVRQHLDKERRSLRSA
jgi:restriction endonuclease